MHIFPRLVNTDLDGRFAAHLLQGERKMKKHGSGFALTVIVIAALLTAAFAAAVAVPCAAALAGAFKKTDETAVYDPLADGPVLRLHVIANSDSERDQCVKLAVRDAVLDYERRQAEAGSALAAENLLLADGSGLMAAVENELEEQGAGYGAQLVIWDFDFPDREYGGVLYPAGSYRALRILLGEGRGKNWWCILFPPLCIIDDGAAQQGPEAPIRFESLLVKLWKLITGQNDPKEEYAE
jgi:stage II sporulation protein R